MIKMHESCIIIYWVSTQDRVPAPFDRLLPEAESTRGEPVSTYNALVLNNDFDNLQTQRMDNRSRTTKNTQNERHIGIVFNQQ